MQHKLHLLGSKLISAVYKSFLHNKNSKKIALPMCKEMCQNRKLLTPAQPWSYLPLAPLSHPATPSVLLSSTLSIWGPDRAIALVNNPVNVHGTLWWQSCRTGLQICWNWKFLEVMWSSCSDYTRGKLPVEIQQHNEWTGDTIIKGRKLL